MHVPCVESFQRDPTPCPNEVIQENSLVSTSARLSILTPHQELCPFCLLQFNIPSSQRLSTRISLKTSLSKTPSPRSVEESLLDHCQYVSTMSVNDHELAPLVRPTFAPTTGVVETPGLQKLIDKLKLQKHPEGGYFVETDRDARSVVNPFISAKADVSDSNSTRSASTTIFYLLTPASPQGGFHRNKARTMHTLHRGRGRYVIIHADEAEKGQKGRVEVFTVGQDVEKGERLQWMVEGGKYKSSFLLPDKEGESKSEGLLISEVTQPIF